MASRPASAASASFVGLAPFCSAAATGTLLTHCDRDELQAQNYLHAAVSGHKQRRADSLQHFCTCMKQASRLVTLAGHTMLTSNGDDIDLVQSPRGAPHAVAHTDCQSVDAFCHVIEGVLLAAVCLDCLGTLCQGGATIPIPNPAGFM